MRFLNILVLYSCFGVVKKVSLILHDVKEKRADHTCDVIKKVAPFVLSKLCILIADWSMRWSRDTTLQEVYLEPALYLST